MSYDVVKIDVVKFHYCEISPKCFERYCVEHNIAKSRDISIESLYSSSQPGEDIQLTIRNS